MSRNEFSTNQGTNEDDSQSDPHPGAGIFGNQTMRNAGQKDQHDWHLQFTFKTRFGDFQQPFIIRAIEITQTCQVFPPLFGASELLTHKFQCSDLIYSQFVVNI